MGWKGTLRSLNAASNRAAREAQKRENATRRAHAKIDKNEAQVIAKARRLQEKASKDPIKAFGLRYNATSGFSSEPFDLHTDLFKGSIDFITEPTGEESSFEPNRAKTKQAAVTPLQMVVTQWATILALQLDNFDREFRLRTPWFKKSDPSSSSIFILDTESSEYYYPIAATLSGEVIPGHPKVALVAFESFRTPTSAVKLCFSEVKLSSERGKKYSFHLSVRRPSLRDRIVEMLAKPSLVEQVSEAVEAEAETLRRQASTGCLVVVAAASGLLALVMAVAL